MNWEFLNDVDSLIFELECALDNLASVHTIMEEEQGVNWQMRCNAVFSTYLQLGNILAELTRCVDQATAKERKSRGMK